MVMHKPFYKTCLLFFIFSYSVITFVDCESKNDTDIVKEVHNFHQVKVIHGSGQGVVRKSGQSIDDCARACLNEKTIHCQYFKFLNKSKTCLLSETNKHPPVDDEDEDIQEKKEAKARDESLKNIMKDYKKLKAKIEKLEAEHFKKEESTKKPTESSVYNRMAIMVLAKAVLHLKQTSTAMNTKLTGILTHQTNLMKDVSTLHKVDDVSPVVTKRLKFVQKLSKLMSGEISSIEKFKKQVHEELVKVENDEKDINEEIRTMSRSINAIPQQMKKSAKLTIEASINALNGMMQEQTTLETKLQKMHIFLVNLTKEVITNRKSSFTAVNKLSGLQASVERIEREFDTLLSEQFSDKKKKLEKINSLRKDLHSLQHKYDDIKAGFIKSNSISKSLHNHLDHLKKSSDALFSQVSQTAQLTQTLLHDLKNVKQKEKKDNGQAKHHLENIEAAVVAALSSIKNKQRALTMTVDGYSQSVTDLAKRVAASWLNQKSTDKVLSLLNESVRRLQLKMASKMVVTAEKKSKDAPEKVEGPSLKRIWNPIDQWKTGLRVLPDMESPGEADFQNLESPKGPIDVHSEHTLRQHDMKLMRTKRGEMTEKFFEKYKRRWGRHYPKSRLRAMAQDRWDFAHYIKSPKYLRKKKRIQNIKDKILKEYKRNLRNLSNFYRRRGLRDRTKDKRFAKRLYRKVYSKHTRFRGSPFGCKRIRKGRRVTYECVHKRDTYSVKKENSGAAKLSRMKRSEMTEEFFEEFKKKWGIFFPGPQLRDMAQQRWDHDEYMKSPEYQIVKEKVDTIKNAITEEYNKKLENLRKYYRKRGWADRTKNRHFTQKIYRNIYKKHTQFPGSPFGCKEVNVGTSVIWHCIDKRNVNPSESNYSVKKENSGAAKLSRMKRSEMTEEFFEEFKKKWGIFFPGPQLRDMAQQRWDHDEYMKSPEYQIVKEKVDTIKNAITEEYNKKLENLRKYYRKRGWADRTKNRHFTQKIYRNFYKKHTQFPGSPFGCKEVNVGTSVIWHCIDKRNVNPSESNYSVKKENSGAAKLSRMKRSEMTEEFFEEFKKKWGIFFPGPQLRDMAQQRWDHDEYMKSPEYQIVKEKVDTIKNAITEEYNKKLENLRKYYRKRGWADRTKNRHFTQKIYRNIYKKHTQFPGSPFGCKEVNVGTSVIWHCIDKRNVNPSESNYSVKKENSGAAKLSRMKRSEMTEEFFEEFKKKWGIFFPGPQLRDMAQQRWDHDEYMKSPEYQIVKEKVDTIKNAITEEYNKKLENLRKYYRKRGWADRTKNRHFTQKIYRNIYKKHTQFPGSPFGCKEVNVGTSVIWHCIDKRNVNPSESNYSVKKENSGAAKLSRMKRSEMTEEFFEEFKKKWGIFFPGPQLRDMAQQRWDHDEYMKSPEYQIVKEKVDTIKNEITEEYNKKLENLRKYYRKRGWADRTKNRHFTQKIYRNIYKKHTQFPGSPFGCKEVNVGTSVIWHCIDKRNVNPSESNYSVKKENSGAAKLSRMKRSEMTEEFFEEFKKKWGIFFPGPQLRDMAQQRWDHDEYMKSPEYQIVKEKVDTIKNAITEEYNKKLENLRKYYRKRGWADRTKNRHFTQKIYRNIYKKHTQFPGSPFGCKEVNVGTSVIWHCIDKRNVNPSESNYSVKKENSGAAKLSRMKRSEMTEEFFEEFKKKWGIFFPGPQLRDMAQQRWDHDEYMKSPEYQIVKEKVDTIKNAITEEYNKKLENLRKYYRKRGWADRTKNRHFTQKIYRNIYKKHTQFPGSPFGCKEVNVGTSVIWHCIDKRNVNPSESNYSVKKENSGAAKLSRMKRSEMTEEFFEEFKKKWGIFFPGPQLRDMAQQRWDHDEYMKSPEYQIVKEKVDTIKNAITEEYNKKLENLRKYYRKRGWADRTKNRHFTQKIYRNIYKKHTQFPGSPFGCKQVNVGTGVIWHCIDKRNVNPSESKYSVKKENSGAAKLSRMKRSEMTEEFFEEFKKKWGIFFPGPQLRDMAQQRWDHDEYMKSPEYQIVKEKVDTIKNAITEEYNKKLENLRKYYRKRGWADRTKNRHFTQRIYRNIYKKHTQFPGSPFGCKEVNVGTSVIWHCIDKRNVNPSESRYSVKKESSGAAKLSRRKRSEMTEDFFEKYKRRWGKHYPKSRLRAMAQDRWDFAHYIKSPKYMRKKKRIRNIKDKILKEYKRNLRNLSNFYRRRGLRDRTKDKRFAKRLYRKVYSKHTRFRGSPFGCKRIRKGRRVTYECVHKRDTYSVKKENSGAAKLSRMKRSEMTEEFFEEFKKKWGIFFPGPQLRDMAQQRWDHDVYMKSPEYQIVKEKVDTIKNAITEEYNKKLENLRKYYRKRGWADRTKNRHFTQRIYRNIYKKHTQFPGSPFGCKEVNVGTSVIWHCIDKRNVNPSESKYSVKKENSGAAKLSRMKRSEMTEEFFEEFKKKWGIFFPGPQLRDMAQQRWDHDEYMKSPEYQIVKEKVDTIKNAITEEYNKKLENLRKYYRKRGWADRTKNRHFTQRIYRNIYKKHTQFPGSPFGCKEVNVGTSVIWHCIDKRNVNPSESNYSVKKENSGAAKLSRMKRSEMTEEFFEEFKKKWGIFFPGPQLRDMAQQRWDHDEYMKSPEYQIVKEKVDTIKNAITEEYNKKLENLRKYYRKRGWADRTKNRHFTQKIYRNIYRKHTQFPGSPFGCKEVNVGTSVIWHCIYKRNVNPSESNYRVKKENSGAAKLSRMKRSEMTEEFFEEFKKKWGIFFPGPQLRDMAQQRWDHDEYMKSPEYQIVKEKVDTIKNAITEEYNKKLENLRKYYRKRGWADRTKNRHFTQKIYRNIYKKHTQFPGSPFGCKEVNVGTSVIWHCIDKRNVDPSESNYSVKKENSGAAKLSRMKRSEMTEEFFEEFKKKWGIFFPGPQLRDMAQQRWDHDEYMKSPEYQIVKEKVDTIKNAITEEYNKKLENLRKYYRKRGWADRTKYRHFTQRIYSNIYKKHTQFPGSPFGCKEVNVGTSVIWHCIDKRNVNPSESNYSVKKENSGAAKLSRRKRSEMTEEFFEKYKRRWGKHYPKSRLRAMAQDRWDFAHYIKSPKYMRKKKRIRNIKDKILKEYKRNLRNLSNFYRRRGLRDRTKDKRFAKRLYRKVYSKHTRFRGSPFGCKRIRKGRRVTYECVHKRDTYSVKKENSGAAKLSRMKRSEMTEEFFEEFKKKWGIFFPGPQLRDMAQQRWDHDEYMKSPEYQIVKEKVDTIKNAITEEYNKKLENLRKYYRKRGWADRTKNRHFTQKIYRNIYKKHTQFPGSPFGCREVNVGTGVIWHCIDKRNVNPSESKYSVKKENSGAGKLSRMKRNEMTEEFFEEFKKKWGIFFPGPQLRDMAQQRWDHDEYMKSPEYQIVKEKVDTIKNAITEEYNKKLENLRKYYRKRGWADRTKNRHFTQRIYRNIYKKHTQFPGSPFGCKEVNVGTSVIWHCIDKRNVNPSESRAYTAQKQKKRNVEAAVLKEGNERLDRLSEFYRNKGLRDRTKDKNFARKIYSDVYKKHMKFQD